MGKNFQKNKKAKTITFIVLVSFLLSPIAPVLAEENTTQILEEGKSSLTTNNETIISDSEDASDGEEAGSGAEEKDSRDFSNVIK